jgi:hypothetical protein
VPPIRGASAVKDERSTTSGHSADTDRSEYSVYFGRERLGRFVRLDTRKFEAFMRCVFNPAHNLSDEN